MYDNGFYITWVCKILYLLDFYLNRKIPQLITEDVRLKGWQKAGLAEWIKAEGIPDLDKFNKTNQFWICNYFQQKKTVWNPT